MGGEYETPSGILGEPYVVEEIKTGRGWSLFRESAMDIDIRLRDAIKADPTGAALAISSLMDGLVEMGNESGLLRAIRLISDKKFSKVLFEMEREKWDKWAAEPVY